MEKKYVSHISKHILMQFGTHKPTECVMIGDNLELDINGAKKCGIDTIWINSKKIVQNNIRTVSVDDISKIDEHLIDSFEIDAER